MNDSWVTGILKQRSTTIAFSLFKHMSSLKVVPEQAGIQQKKEKCKEKCMKIVSFPLTCNDGLMGYVSWFSSDQPTIQENLS